jgi:hypothetical protein
MTTMTHQELFDTVATHLFTQGEQSLCESGSVDATCAYRGDNGLTCAVGCILPDDIYTNDMEGEGVQSDLVSAAIAEAYGAEAVPLLTCLQHCHDNPINWRTSRMMRRQLSNVAQAEGLCPDIVYNLEFVNPYHV